MSEGSQISKIERSINEIIASCRNDPAKAEIAKVNFINLIEIMKKYEKGPKYYNAIMEDSDTQGILQTQTFPMQIEKRVDDGSNSTILIELQKIYSRKLKQKELQILGTKLAGYTGLKLDRDTKRSKQHLLNWFASNWQMLHLKIYEFNLEKLDFNSSNTNT